MKKICLTLLVMTIAFLPSCDKTPDDSKAKAIADDMQNTEWEITYATLMDGGLNLDFDGDGLSADDLAIEWRRATTLRPSSVRFAEHDGRDPRYSLLLTLYVPYQYIHCVQEPEKGWREDEMEVHPAEIKFYPLFLHADIYMDGILQWREYQSDNFSGTPTYAVNKLTHVEIRSIGSDDLEVILYNYMFFNSASGLFVESPLLLSLHKLI